MALERTDDNKLAELERKLLNHAHNGIDSQKLEVSVEDVTDLPNTLGNAPLASVSAPNSGTINSGDAGTDTVIASIRSTVNTLITRLETLGLIEEN